MQPTQPTDQQSYALGYNVGYQHGYQAANNGGGGAQGPQGYPINLVGRHPQSSSRLLMLFFVFRPFLLIPHFFCLWFLSIAQFFVVFLAWWVVLFTGQYPQGMWEFNLGVSRWQSRAAAYVLALTDEYPPFSLT